MTANTYLVALANALSKTEIPSFEAGASGYFSKPQATLDPALFDGDVIRPEVRVHVVMTLLRFWRRQGFREPERWATVWLAGSGISYQWAGDRGNGDLDTIIGIDWPVFYQCNSQWVHTDIDETTEFIDNQLRSKLWPRTAHTVFGGKTFELTYYVNQDASDIRNIHPYAAYNLTTGSWTVRPSEHTAYEDDPGTPTWRSYAAADLEQARAIRNAIIEARSRVEYTGSAQWVNVMSVLARNVAYGIQLMNEIHGSRRMAFAPGGKGYWDFNNWRWQMAKKNGIVAVLGALEHINQDAVETAERRLYGQTLTPADQLTIRAAMSQEPR